VALFCGIRTTTTARRIEWVEPRANAPCENDLSERRSPSIGGWLRQAETEEENEDDPLAQSRNRGRLSFESPKMHGAVGWAIRAFTPVFDGLWALARPSTQVRDSRAPCPRVTDRRVRTKEHVGTAYEGFLTWTRSAGVFAHPTSLNMSDHRRLSALCPDEFESESCPPMTGRITPARNQTATMAGIHMRICPKKRPSHFDGFMRAAQSRIA
jgi:hypothetical protein